MKSVRPLLARFPPLLKCAIKTFESRSNIRDLDPAARFGMSQNFCKERLPVADTANHISDVDEFYRSFGSKPWFCSIVNFKYDIGRDPDWLDKRYIDACYFHRVVLVAHLDCPNARARPDVEDVLQGRSL
jgi:hypothetical protein